MIRRHRPPVATRPVVHAPDPAAALAAENAALRARVAELEALLATATEPAPEPAPAERRPRR
jgi:hypothetical protein